MYGEVLESGRSGGASNNSGRGGRRLVYRQEHDAAGRTRQVAAKPSAARVQLGDGGFDRHLTDGLAGLALSKRRNVHGSRSTVIGACSAEQPASRSFVACREATPDDRANETGSFLGPRSPGSGWSSTLPSAAG